MLRWLQDLIFRRAAPLTGAPAQRRRKSYQATSGYVYQYHYAGLRRAGSGTEYVFMVSAAQRGSAPVTVLVPDRALAGWQRDHERELTPTERYAIAKMALFAAFDERDRPEALSEPVRVDPERVRAILDELDV